MGAFTAILGKELRLEWRTKESLAVMIIFAVAVILLFAFAFNLGSKQIASISPGLIWMTYLFSAILGLLRSFGREKEMEAYDMLLSAPVDRAAIFLGKGTAFCLLLITTQIISLPLFSLFLDVNIGMKQIMLIPVFLLADISIAAVGTIIAGIGIRSPHGDTLLSILLFPLITPLLIATTRATGAVLAARPIAEWDLWLMMQVTYAVVFVVLGSFIFDYISEQ